MRTLAGLLTLLILQSFCMTALAQAPGSCQSGYYWNPSLNRCVISIETAETKGEALKCSGLSGDKYKECFNKIANNKVNDLQDAGKIEDHENSFTKGNGTKIAIPLVISVLTGYYLFLNKDKFENCKSTSMWLLFGGGVVSLVGEISAQFKFKKDTKDLEEQYKEKMKVYESDKKVELATQNQKIAFDYLIAANQARYDAEKARKGTYNLARILYAAAGAMAIVESIQTGFKYGKASCGGGKKTSYNNAQKHYDYLTLFADDFDGYSHVENMTGAELLEVILRKVYDNLIPTAHAQSETRSELADGRWIDGDGNIYETSTSTTSIGTLKDGQSITLKSGEQGTYNKGIGYKKDDTSICAKGKVKDKTGNCVPESEGTDPNKLMGVASKVIGTGDGKAITGLVKNNYGEVINSPMGKKQMNFLDEALATPYVRAALAGVLYLYADTLRKEAENNMTIAENRINAIKKLRAEFVASGGAGYSMCTTKQRKDKNQPRCFCYTEDGAKDKAKSKLAVCEQLFAQFEFQRAGDYTKNYGGTIGNKSVCVNRKKQVDYMCKCKGSNTCMKVSSKFNLAGIGGGSWLKSLSAPTDNLLSGNLGGSDLDTTKLNDMALKMKKKFDSMENDPKYKANFKKAKSLSNKLQSGHKSWYKKSFGNSVPRSLASSSLGAAGASAAPTTVADVVKQAKAEMKSASANFKKGKSLGTASEEKKEGFDFDWGSDGNAKGGTQVEEFAQVMDKKYAIKGDINNNPSQNLFQILSIRYQRSGLRRLFDEEGKSSKDAANIIDINEK